MKKSELKSLIREEVREALNSIQPSTGNLLGKHITGMGPQAQKALAQLEGFLMDFGFFQSAKPQEVKDLAELIFNVCQEYRKEGSSSSTLFNKKGGMLSFDDRS